MSPPTITRPVAIGRAATVRVVAIGASLLAGVLYLLIGLGLLDIGTSTNGGVEDPFAFGAVMAVVSAAVAVALWRFVARPVWIAVAVVEVVVLVGYVAISSIREPPFELWGALVKACQVVTLGAVAYLLLHRRDIEAAVRPETRRIVA